jgi:hypothetical protein
MFLSPDNRKLLIALLAIPAAIFALVGSNVGANHAPKPQDLPVGVVGTPSAVRAAAVRLERRTPNGFSVHRYPSLADARAAILHRSVYGALRPGRRPLLLVASAAGSAVVPLLQQTFAARRGVAPVAIAVRDVAPLPASDSHGATSPSAVLSLLFVGLLGPGLIFAVTERRRLRVRLAALFVVSVSAGLVAALITNVIVGAFPRHFLAVWGVAALFALAMCMSVAAFQVLLGPYGGVAVGWTTFLVIGNPASGAASAPQLLPVPWRTVSQILPPGAASTAMHNAVYFGGHGAAAALLALAAWAIAGAAGALIIDHLRTRAGSTEPASRQLMQGVPDAAPGKANPSSPRATAGSPCR